MSTNARIYAAAILSLSACALVGVLADSRRIYASQFAVMFLVCVVLTCLNTRTTGLRKRHRSISLALLLASIAVFTTPQASAIAVAVVLLEDLLMAHGRTDSISLIYKLASVLVSVVLTHHTVHGHFFFTPNTPALVRLLFGAVVLFVSTTFPLAALSALSRGASLLQIWYKEHFRLLPSALIGAVVALAFQIGIAEAGWFLGILVLPVAYLLFRSYCASVDGFDLRRKHIEQMANLHLRTIEALALAIEAKDTTTHDHLKRVTVYALELGRELGLNEEEIEALRAAALLHDIGKLAVPEYIISKPGKLTPEEFEKMKIHPVVGAEILEHVQFPYPVVPIVRAHHEKWNGTGYPDGLAGTDIPMGARILSAVDALDALATDRQYRRALPLDEAMSKVESESGRSFDPVVIEILKRRYRELERIAQGQHGIGLKLSTSLRISAGDAPAAGFEEQAKPAAQANGSTAVQSTLTESVARARNDLSQVFSDSASSSSTLTLSERLAVFAVKLKQVIPFDAFVVYSLRDERLLPTYVTGDNYKLFSNLEIPLGQGLSGWVAENRKPILNGNPSVEPGYLNDPRFFSTLRSALAVPLEGEDRVVGVLAIYQDAPNAFSKDHLRILQSIGPKLAFWMENLRQSSDTAPGIESDYLAELPDAYAFFTQLEREMVRSRRMNAPLSLIVCSLEGIGNLTDRLGGREALRLTGQVAKALNSECREIDFIAKVGSNEFAMLLPGMPAPVAAQRALALAHVAGLGKVSGITLIAGAASYPEDGEDGLQLIAVADRRIHAKRTTPPLPIPATRSALANWVQ
ncbi:MAG TPA: HD domain-containing phosphohydrolase [Bryobacteraceae bacterium]|jgi:putative nucleotidyltransferase with HDIG domain/diguanylate cyclase (GGDEF)-like protein|nr:HD domain-containing phosphohydrolase [Bryobacteraceae bacterium]